jgi:hypothetical protein
VLRSIESGEIAARRPDLGDAGTFPVFDEQVVTDGNITTSRSPDDLRSVLRPDPHGVRGQA